MTPVTVPYLSVHRAQYHTLTKQPPRDPALLEFVYDSTLALRYMQGDAEYVRIDSLRLMCACFDQNSFLR